MKKQSVVAFFNKKAELSSSEQELLKGTFDALRVSPKRVKETMAQAKARNQRKGQP